MDEEDQSIKINNDDFEDSNEENDLLEENENNLGRVVLETRSFLINQFKKPIFKWFMYAILIIIPPMYFGFAIALNNPFDFSKKYNQRNIGTKRSSFCERSRACIIHYSSYSGVARTSR